MTEIIEIEILSIGGGRKSPIETIYSASSKIFMRFYKKEDDLSAESIQKLRSSFDRFDLDQSGSINILEMTRVRLTDTFQHLFAHIVPGVTWS